MEIRAWADRKLSENSAELPLLTTVQGGLRLVWLVEESVLPDVTCSSAQRGPAFCKKAEIVCSQLCCCIRGWKIPQPFSSFSQVQSYLKPRCLADGVVLRASFLPKE